MATGMTLAQAMAARRTQREFSAGSVPLQVVQRLLWAAYGVSEDGGKRTTPSAHALHPLRLYACAGRIEGAEPGVYAVAPDAHDMSLHIGRDVRADLEAAALEDQPWIGHSAGIITICADMVAATSAFADQPPYGTRGLRYIHIEAGAAAQNMYLQAAADGIACVLVAGFQDEVTAGVLKLAAPVAPVLHLCFGWPAES
ncbi:MAG: SagB/ThcOx family dehydrogenase [Pseudomonadota bacterium]